MDRARMDRVSQSHGDPLLREVQDEDLEVFFHHQLDPEALEMAAFPGPGSGCLHGSLG